jgi:hypothetical protein
MPARSQRESGKAATKQTTKTPNHAKPFNPLFPTPRSGFVQQDHWSESGGRMQFHALGSYTISGLSKRR